MHTIEETLHELSKDSCYLEDSVGLENKRPGWFGKIVGPLYKEEVQRDLGYDWELPSYEWNILLRSAGFILRELNDDIQATAYGDPEALEEAWLRCMERARKIIPFLQHLGRE